MYISFGFYCIDGFPDESTSEDDIDFRGNHALDKTPALGRIPLLDKFPVLDGIPLPVKILVHVEIVGYRLQILFSHLGALL